uniref:Uncharacterized protein n=1 Tax=Haplochromis burtoni TaxID=8153 RepID=A0A3Q3BQ34_HAPBU
MLHIIHIITYQDFVRVFSAYGESDAIYGKIDGACVGHGLASPVVILHSHLERHQPRLLRAKPYDVLAGPLEVIVVPIKRVVVRVAPGPAGACVFGDARSLALLNSACLLSPTKGQSSTCLCARGCGEVVTGISIEVTAQSTSLTSITAAQSDHKPLFPIITDCQTKIGLNEHRASALMHSQFVIIQGYWQTPQNIVNLPK